LVIEGNIAGHGNLTEIVAGLNDLKTREESRDCETAASPLVLVLGGECVTQSGVDRRRRGDSTSNIKLLWFFDRRCGLEDAGNQLIHGRITAWSWTHIIGKGAQSLVQVLLGEDSAGA